MLITYDESLDQSAKIKVVGVGGAGGNAINRMIQNQLKGVEFIAINTDAQALNANLADVKLQIGRKYTRGLGAGAIAETGRKAAEESKDTIAKVLEGVDLVFITAGMGGGTGTGASPIIAEIARNLGALTVGIVTKPFLFEGPTRMKHAQEGIIELKKYVDTLIVIKNQKLLEIVNSETGIEEALLTADSILNQATSGISDLITKTGIINLDFADIKTVVKDMGDAVVGTAEASGPSRAVMAASMAISSPLLDNVSIKGAKGILINFTGGPDMKLSEIHEAAEIIHQEAGEDTNTNIIFGVIVDETFSDKIRVTVIATGFNKENQPESPELSHTESPKPKHYPQENNQTTFILSDQSEKNNDKKHVVATSTLENQEKLFTDFSTPDLDDFETPAWIRKYKNKSNIYP
ncbi:MAG: cell division protein FtsZ [Candidatus Marinimicrobia bacterium]|nr:cell division protein FtsZ [Candidatus Neomarinimicrobiota bacterium]MDD5582731.1 cell division protein FtsZ [Candidatus Neomarinimicrobiota bacterium]